MLRRIPKYMDAFVCMGAACPDCCCVGWEIDVDADTCARYLSLQGLFGDRLRRNIQPGEPAQFCLQPGDRCPFLNEQNLCDIILNLGEDWLCQICDRHPRYMDRFGGVLEMGVGLACPAAARLILSGSPTADCRVEEADDRRCAGFEDPGVCGPFTEFLFSARRRAFEICRLPAQTLPERLHRLIDLASVLQETLETGGIAAAGRALKAGSPFCLQMNAEKPEPAEILDETLQFFESLEPLDELWPRTVTDTRCALASGAVPEMNSEQSTRLLEYFIFRYFMKAVYDGDLYGKMALAVVSTVVISCLTARPSDADPENTARLFSKNIEYAEENLEAIYEECIPDGLFKTENLHALAQFKWDWSARENIEK